MAEPPRRLRRLAGRTSRAGWSPSSRPRRRPPSPPTSTACAGCRGRGRQPPRRGRGVARRRPGGEPGVGAGTSRRRPRRPHRRPRGRRAAPGGGAGAVAVAAGWAWPPPSPCAVVVLARIDTDAPRRRAGGVRPARPAASRRTATRRSPERRRGSVVELTASGLEPGHHLRPVAHAARRRLPGRGSRPAPSGRRGGGTSTSRLRSALPAEDDGRGSGPPPPTARSPWTPNPPDPGLRRSGVAGATSTRLRNARTSAGMRSGTRPAMRRRRGRPPRPGRARRGGGGWP